MRISLLLVLAACGSPTVGSTDSPSLVPQFELALSATTLHPGDALTGTMTWVDREAAPVDVLAAAIAARPPGGSHDSGPYLDLTPYAGAVTVEPGGTLTLDAQRTFRDGDPLGTWDIYPTYETSDGVWHDGPDSTIVLGPTDDGGALVTGPLDGAVPGDWQSGDVDTGAMHMHFNYLLPFGYDASRRYPVLVWLHENDMGNPYYQGGDPFGLASYINDWFNTSEFRRAYPCIVIAPYADQTADPSGETANFGGWVPPGDHGVNEDGVVAVVAYVSASFAVASRKIYVTGASLGGIGSWALMLDYNAINGAFGRVFAAGLPMAGVIERFGFGVDPPQAVIDQMRDVPVFAVHGAGDGESQPSWDRAMWRAYGGGQLPGAPGAAAPAGAFHYLEDPALGHDVWDTYAGLPAGAPLYDWMFAQSAP
jgi:poly(3-hydroxybutyrate) depolymerase